MCSTLHGCLAQASGAKFGSLEKYSALLSQKKYKDFGSIDWIGKLNI